MVVASNVAFVLFVPVSVVVAFGAVVVVFASVLLEDGVLILVVEADVFVAVVAGDGPVNWDVSEASRAASLGLSTVVLPAVPAVVFPAFPVVPPLSPASSSNRRPSFDPVEGGGAVVLVVVDGVVESVAFCNEGEASLVSAVWSLALSEGAVVAGGLGVGVDVDVGAFVGVDRGVDEGARLPSDDEFDATESGSSLAVAASGSLLSTSSEPPLVAFVSSSLSLSGVGVGDVLMATVRGKFVPVGMVYRKTQETEPADHSL